MLERVQADHSVVFYRSKVLHSAGIPHGFSTRLGGVSTGVFASLNLGNPSGSTLQDDKANIALNYARLQAAIGCEGRARVSVWQVHGDRVVASRAGEDFDCDTQADAVVTDDPQRVASVRTADCVPVLLSTADGRAVAAVHAGWRGVVAGVVLRAVEAVRQMRPGVSLLVAIGPGIGYDQFEVGPEVIVKLKDAFGADADGLYRRSTSDGKFLVDLRAALMRQLLGAGLQADAMDTTDRCSLRDRDEFYSHRRDNGVTGRMASLIGPIDSR